MKSKYSSFPSSPTRRRASFFTKAIILCFGGAIVGLSQSAQAAPNVTHSITATGDGTWTGATWSNATPDGATAGDIATPGAISSVTLLNSDVTLGALFDTGSGRTWTINSNATNVFTLNGTGISSSNNGFGHADTAALRINTTGAGAFAINPNLVLATSTDIGTTSGDDEIVVGGNITASAAVTLNFQNDSTSTGVAQSVTGGIGASGSTIAITNNSAVTAVASSVTLSGALGSSVTGITQNSPTATLNLNGVSGSFGGPITISAGTVTIGSAGQLGAAGLYAQNISNAGTLNYNSSASQTFSGILSGAGALTKGTSTTGTLALSGANTYSGATTISSGTLAGIGANAFGSTSSISIAGAGILSLRGDSNTSFVKAIDSSAYTITTTATGATVNVDQATVAGTSAKTMTISSIATTSTAATYTVNFTGANNTNLAVGTITGAASTAAGVVTLSNNNTAGTTMIGTYTSANTTGGETLTLNGAGNTTISGAIVNGTVSQAVNKSTGAGTVTLSGNNTYTGNTTVSAGTLVLSGSNSNGATAITSINGGTLQLQANVGNTTADISSALGTASGKLIFDANNAALQLRSDSAVSFGPGTTTMDASENGSYTIDVDRLTAGTGAVLTVGSISSAGATINVTGNSTGTGSSLSTGSIGGSSGGVRTLTINPTTANITVAGMNQGGIAGSSVVLTGTSTGNAITGAITGANAALTKSGTSTWTLNGTNTYGGATTVSAGTLSLTQNNSLSNSANVNVATAGTLDLNFTGTDTVNAFLIDGVPQAAGEWGRTGSGAANTTARITGDGRIFATTAGSAYDTWATTKGLTVANNGATQDPENDGTGNLLEFVLNGNPLTSDTSILPVLSDDGTYFIFTFNRADSSLGEVALKFEYGSDLTGWTPVTIPTSATGIPVNITDNGATDQVQVKVLKTSAVGGKLFGRLQAVK